LTTDTTSEELLVRIEPTRGWKIIDLKELKRFRELIYFMTWRDLKVRYKQTVLGVAWAIIQPLMTMVVFSIFFGNLAKVPSDGIPYPLFSLAGLLPWQLFENSLRNASRSLVGNRNMITKIYFPRVVLPMSSVLASVVDFLVALPILIGFMIYYGYSPNIYALLIPYYLLLTVGLRGWTLVFSAERAVSRYRVYSAVYHSVMDVPDADRLWVRHDYEP